MNFQSNPAASMVDPGGNKPERPGRPQRGRAQPGGAAAAEAMPAEHRPQMMQQPQAHGRPTDPYQQQLQHAQAHPAEQYRQPQPQHPPAPQGHEQRAAAGYAGAAPPTQQPRHRAERQASPAHAGHYQQPHAAVPYNAPQPASSLGDAPAPQSAHALPARRRAPGQSRY
eukprot:TRINITY_DN25326_c0_g1_i1.p4 TRINITY_DN25326_c0_g1~~TRINITY_DN25326_c0_g1_i1.p4  ORF type:complete len:169 (+),score=39.36 TRINITY_DN25326_c0_g1_i1:64-570(+)